ncbi:hypothetical protein AK830_g4333 [Neonectria ditissima]|uniref:Zn(2)-C6 fungal-type domain-containing protein n=1 Tax=Neonectria ditissima TaxID=78410 RepID=A0A0P7AWA5_9HYPO|nr:hypothetical protein AK830_g4333 [Neonectria ditissima]
MAGNKEKLRQACDNCRFRKVKCNRGRPCNNCDAGALDCQYLHTIQRKGARRGQGRRQSQLRRGLAGFDEGLLRIITPDTHAALRHPSNSSPDSVGSSHHRPQSLPEQTYQPPASASTSASPPTDSHSTSENVTPQPTLFGNSTSSLDDLLEDAAGYSRRLSLSLFAHIQIFLKYLFPIMPAVDGDDLLADAIRLDELPPSRYALIVSLCAITRIQLRMDSPQSCPGEGPGAHLPLEPQLTGEMLIGLAENSLRQYSVIDDTSLDSILSSFFLFASYGNLDNARHAWFYLNQSISLAQSLDLTRESGYTGLPENERERRRRLFWLLFVTERTFALQHRRGVQLRSSIVKPQVVDSNCPAVMHDFLNHIRLFELLPCSLYEWQPQGDQQPDDLTLTHEINNKLCSISADRSVIESQRFDTLITQQWLRVSMWRLAFGKKPSSAYNRGLLLPLSVPIDAGKMIVTALDSVGSKSKDCHGIGMEQKLFDVGISLVDSALLPSWSHSSFEIGPRNLLHAVIRALSEVNGRPSYLLPMLLKHSVGVMDFADPTAHIDIQWDMPQERDNLEQAQVVEEIPEQVEETIECMSWAMEDDLGLFDLGTPALTPLCEVTTTSGTGFDQEVM